MTSNVAHGPGMKRFKYQAKDGKEFWICPACKKTHTEPILLKKWMLIDRHGLGDECAFCQASATPPQPPGGPRNAIKTSQAEIGSARPL